MQGEFIKNVFYFFLLIFQTILIPKEYFRENVKTPLVGTLKT